MPAHYSKADLIAALRALGLRAGQLVFCHSNIGLFGIPAEGNSREVADRIVLEAFQEVLGPEGTLCVPTFTYSFCKAEVYDPDATPSTCGRWSEIVRTLPGARRSLDPIFSVAAIGPLAESLTRDISEECFGPGSFWERFLEADGFICNLNFYVPLTGFHYLEKRAGAKYRFDKRFRGTFSIQGQTRPGSAIFFCQDKNNPDTQVSLHAFDERLLATGAASKIEVGRGYITGIYMRELQRQIERTLSEEPYFLIEAGRKGLTPVLDQPKQVFEIALPETASMVESAQSLWTLPREPLSDGFAVALNALSAQLPMTMHAYPTGLRVGTALVPERWTCHEARLETLDGQVIFSRESHLLHVAAYSQPFEGVVSREVLFQHLHVHPDLPTAIPAVSLADQPDWALCCSQLQRDDLSEAEYRVVIRSEFSFGHLRVGEVLIQGEREDCFVLCTHLDPSAQVANGLSGVIAGIEVMRVLSRRQNRYSYRLVILPQGLGAACWLADHESVIPQIIGGLALDGLSLSKPLVLQTSALGDSTVDRCLRQAFQTHVPEASVVTVGTATKGDEVLFNGAEVRVPMLSLSRFLPSPKAASPYPEYLSSADTLALVSWPHLEESVQVILRLMEALESA